MTKEEQKEKFNELGKRFWQEKKKGFPDETEKRDLRIEIAKSLFTLFSGTIRKTSYTYEELASDLFEEILEKFDYSKGKQLYWFTKERFQHRARDQQRRDFGMKNMKETQEDGTVTQNWQCTTISLDAPVKTDNTADNNKNNPMRIDTKEQKQFVEGEIEEWEFYELFCSELLMLMMELPNRLQGRKNTEMRRNYCRMFYTEDIVKILHEFPVQALLERRERDLFEHSMQLNFLDFFMQKPYRTVRELFKGRLKPYGELVDKELPEEKRMAETKLPLSQDVYVSYMERVEEKSVADATLSGYRKDYLELLEPLRHLKK